MATLNPKMARESAVSRRVPALESGDHLSRTEFERRYAAMPGPTNAELIEGVVYVSSPVRTEQHGRPHAALVGWLMLYWSHTPGVDLSDNGTVRLDPDNEPQPDALLRILAERGGQSRIDQDGYVAGPPELIAEIAASSASYDLHEKLRAYQLNGVREYLVWRVLEHRLDWFALREGRYRLLQPDAGGVIESAVFPGLRLDTAALLQKNLPRLLAVQQRGIGSPEHRAFVERLVG